jgi:hypothetical protein
MALSLFEAVFAHIDVCRRCDPSGNPLCPAGQQLLQAAADLAAEIYAPTKTPRKKGDA